jgi:putative Holliday junction resolvase
MLRGKLLALDVGLARIGVAVCDPLRLAARPLQVIVRRSRREDFDQLARLVQEQEAVAIVVGLPLNMDGSEGPQAQTVRKWAERLAYALRALGALRPVIFWDERLSTFEAQALLAEQHVPVAEDAAAAAVILERYLEAQRQVTTLEQVQYPFGIIVLAEATSAA